MRGAQAAAEPTAEELIAALAAMPPWDRASVLIALGEDPGPRSWTSTGRELGIKQWVDGDGHVFADWPDEIRRSHRVYFVQAGEPDADGFCDVKIGFTTDIDQRLRQLQTAQPEPLKVVGRVIGTQAIEAFFHRLLRGQRIRGEWYLLRPGDIAEATVRLYEEGLWS